MSEQFKVTISKLGINPCVDVPARVSDAFANKGYKGYISVCGTINGSSFRAGLVSKGGGRHRLFINSQMRKAAGVDTGDRISVVLEYDLKPRRIPLPQSFKTALESDKRAKKAWENLTPSKRKEILSYLNSLKRPDTLKRNIQRTIQGLLNQ